MPKTISTDFTESTRPGTVYQIFEIYKKSESDKSGVKPVYIEREDNKKKHKSDLNN